MIKLNKKVLEYFDFEEAVCFIAQKYNKNVYDLESKLVADVIGDQEIFTLCDPWSDITDEFVKEFGEDAHYIWER